MFQGERKVDLGGRMSVGLSETLEKRGTGENSPIKGETDTHKEKGETRNDGN